MKLSRNKLGIVGACVAVLALAGVVIAQVTPPTVTTINTGDLFQDIQNGQSAPTNFYASIQQIRSFILGQNSTHTAAPTLTTSGSTCGGTGATVLGTDVSGAVTEAGSASTSCVITFAKAFVTAPECFVSLQNATDASLKCSTSTTAATITQTSASSNVLNYLIVGVPGG